MIDYLFGWIYKTPMEDTIIDLIISGLEILLLSVLVYKISIIIGKLLGDKDE